jgi:hypothetical protein
MDEALARPCLPPEQFAVVDLQQCDGGQHSVGLVTLM